MAVQILTGDCRALLPTLSDASVDAIVTDPPYGLEFMGVAWDTMREDGKARTRNEWGDFGSREHARTSDEAPRIRRNKGLALQAFSESWVIEAYRVLRPGAHLLAFGGTRTFHRLTCAIEDAGFEIRDCLSWLYGSGFPKSLNLGPRIGEVATPFQEQWDGWGTALKPAWEPIILARKPLIGTVAANVERYGTGAINVDGCRIETDERPARLNGTHRSPEEKTGVLREGKGSGMANGATSLGRWPANVCLDEEAAAMLDAQTGTLTSGANPTRRGSPKTRNTYGEFEGQRECTPARGVDVGGASRFYYVAKASRSERNAGLDGMPERVASVGNMEAAGRDPANPANHYRTSSKERMARGEPPTIPRANHHPTVKPISLMRWLVRLVTPAGGLVLDPFMGSGSTGIACVREGFGFIGIEQDEAYVEIARRRITGDAPLFADVSLA